MVPLHTEHVQQLRQGARQISLVIRCAGLLFTDVVVAVSFVFFLLFTPSNQGQIYRLGDFIIRIGSCRKGAVFRGLALEVNMSQEGSIYLWYCYHSDGLHR